MAVSYAVYSQRDPRWARKQIGLSIGRSVETIGSAGCLITSLAMLVSGTRPDVTPDAMERALCKSGKIGRRGCAACLNTFDVSDLWPEVKLTYVSKRWPGPVPVADLDRLIAHLRSDQPALIEVDIDLRTGPLNQHFVLAPGAASLPLAGVGTLIVHDPWWGDIADIVPRYGRDLARAVWRYVLYSVAAVPGAS